MEVHHHSHHPKKWKEYITEFLMLFLAVSLGFMAENIREHQIEKQREIAYLQNVHEDLRLDLNNIDNVLNQNKSRLLLLDTFFNAIKNKTITNEEAYYYIRNLVLRATFESSHVGLDQIKSAGGLRMIKNKEIVTGIQEYERTLDATAKMEVVREGTLEQARFQMAVVFDPIIQYQMMKSQNYQGVGWTRFQRPQKADLILEKNPAPWACYFQAPGIDIASASPELFLKREGKRIRTSPIKGTAPVGTTDFGVKDRAENVMIVDLMRNDLGQICKSGSVTVPRLLSTEAHPGLVHLVSDIEGELKEGTTWSEIFTLLSPPGSISGAPKSSAVSVIEENEGKRGPYCGALGWVQGDQSELSVAIRIFFKDDKLRFGTGAGITWASVADDEWEETQLKARRLVSLAGGVL